MTLSITIAIVLLIAALVVGWLLTLLGLPGNWLMLLAAAVYSVWGPVDGRPEMATLTVVGLLVLAVIGEILEFILGAVGARRAGGSRRAAVGALGGGLTGGVVGLFVGLPVPIIGSLISAVLFAALGALVGAFLAQRSLHERHERQKAWAIGKAAFWGRLGGTLAKLAVGTLMVLVALAALVV